MSEDSSKSKDELLAELLELRMRLNAAEDALLAIQAGEVDAVVVSGPEGERIFTLQGAESSYRFLVEAMNEGAASISAAGTILYVNHRLSALLQIAPEFLIGNAVQNLVTESDKGNFQRLLERAIEGEPGRAEIELRVSDGKTIPCKISLGSMQANGPPAVSFVATDLREQRKREELQKQAEEDAKELSARILSAQDEERRKIARELHDSFGQSLTALKFSLNAVIQGAGQLDAKNKSLLVDGSDLVDQCLTETRTLSHLLHPPLLDEVGLHSAVEWYIDGFRKRSGISTKLQLPPEIHRLPADIEIALFRVLQESLTNVHRHSGSQMAEVCLQHGPQHVELVVKDYGRGIHTDQLRLVRDASFPAGVGLAGMKERVRQLGGRLEIRSDDAGTTVMVAIPSSNIA